MQFVLIYLNTWGSTQPYTAFLTLEFGSSFFVFGGTHRTPNFLMLQKPVSCFVCSLFSRLMDGACLLCLAIKMPSGEGSLLFWGGSVVTHSDPL